MDPLNEPPKVQFEEEQWQQPSRVSYAEPSKATLWILQHSGGLLKNEKQIAYVLIAFIAVLAIVMGMMLFGNGGNATFKAPPGQKILYPPNAPPRLEKI
ncbi:TPA: hypothetical protein DIV48_03415 [Candidatus Kaiserbacteria bacterium]|nr:MAG: hypothetical protein UY93_C0003G0049 [Parcubacteria group bacterium GW2011_GWA1_56_13]KKW45811.1 MAG: hypothetical protein UY97_C0014G0009 [Parcubacteria group bacterium GW2011_GWB1_57_6]HCR52661.1 hypothetical protein [Candidatus Kaiserbacteria bacterium]